MRVSAPLGAVCQPRRCPDKPLIQTAERVPIVRRAAAETVGADSRERTAFGQALCGVRASTVHPVGVAEVKDVYGYQLGYPVGLGFYESADSLVVDSPSAFGRLFGAIRLL